MNGKSTGVDVGKGGSGKLWGLQTRPIMPVNRRRVLVAYPQDTNSTQIIHLRRIRWL